MRNKFHVSLLVLAFQLSVAFQILIVPLAARNVKGSVANKPEMLVIIAGGANVTSIYDSFSEFKRMFGVEFPEDRRIAFKSGEGEFINIPSMHILPIDFSPIEPRKFIVDVVKGSVGCDVVPGRSCMEAFIHEPFCATGALISQSRFLLACCREKKLLYDDGEAETAITIKNL